MAQAGLKSTRVVEASPPQPKNHFGNMEEQIHDLSRAADLAADMLERTLDDSRFDEVGPGSYEASYLYMREREERLVFAADEVRKRAKALRDFFVANPA